MQALLVRVGIDQAYGHWNAPVDPDTREFVYVPIPESRKQEAHLATSYDASRTALARFAGNHAAPRRGVELPDDLRHSATHLDPDFNHLTYGDNGDRRGRLLTMFGPGDIVVFYAGLRPIRRSGDVLVYAIIGLYRVAEVLRASDVPRARWHENAHTRCADRCGNDVIVRGDPGRSGRLRACLPIGEWRDGAYRVKRELLDAWGGLSVRDGYIQRSAVPPRILDPRRFLQWFEAQGAQLVARN